MPSQSNVRLLMLRVLLGADAAVLLALGGLFMALPGSVTAAFGFAGLPPATGYMIGLWGCALVSLAVGYLCAVQDPLRNVTWVRAGIVRGALECAFGILVVCEHLVTWRQASFGTVVAGAFAVAYFILYPAEVG
jgi:hypothetical protein